MSLNQIPRDKKGKPLKFCQTVTVDSDFLGPPKWGRVMHAGLKKSIISLEGGSINEFDNSKIEIRIDI